MTGFGLPFKSSESFGGVPFRMTIAESSVFSRRTSAFGGGIPPLRRHAVGPFDDALDSSAAWLQKDETKQAACCALGSGKRFRVKTQRCYLMCGYSTCSFSIDHWRLGALD